MDINSVHSDTTDWGWKPMQGGLSYQRPEERFQPGSMNARMTEPGVKVMTGRHKATGKRAIHRIDFTGSRWNSEAPHDWMVKNQKKFPFYQSSPAADK